MDTYQISSVIDTKVEGERLSVNISINGSSKTFQKNVKEIYTKEWLEKFSPEDVAYIGFLAAAEFNGDRQLINSFSKRKSIVTNSVVFFGNVVCVLPAHVKPHGIQGRLYFPSIFE